ncbi:alkaline phosphatase D family protein [Halegenticoccus soli]|uniref:alkaline phosphatase D family protein n=1 Tax=Halegenticoccus soli TaxID=1985678 RepID=UPI0018EAF527|nr:alkaline phosphatase D family protein [Halegenticoccus soli]
MLENVTRRDVMRTAAAAALAEPAVTGSVAAERTVSESADSEMISAPYGAQVGDVREDRALIWSRADGPARMYVHLSTDDDFSDAKLIRGPAALAATDYTATVDLVGFPSGEEIHYRVVFESLRNPGKRSAPVGGSFRTPPSERRDVRFVWGGDVAGQGWGINPEFGGMKTFEAMLATDPDFFVHSGDAVYADGPLPECVELDDGGVWRNVVTEAKSDVADTPDEFRGNYRYNLLDDHYRRFVSEVPMIPQWDDHEVTNNWYPDEILPADDPHDVRSVNLLAARGQRAFLEYMPIRPREDAADAVYENFPYGPSLEVFRLDMRSYRGPNTENTQTDPGPNTALLGEEQLTWLKESLAASEATWKVIASDMPIGLVVPDGDRYEAVANADDGTPKGRELEIKELLSFMQSAGVRNVVWVTADVHYTAAHHYHPDRAEFSEFDPFWEFVSGPLHAGTFGPNDLDDTFGPEVVFERTPPEGEANLPPSEGLQFFGQVDVDADTEALTVTLKDLHGDALYTEDLAPAGR